MRAAQRLHARHRGRRPSTCRACSRPRRTSTSGRTTSRRRSAPWWPASSAASRRCSSDTALHGDRAHHRLGLRRPQRQRRRRTAGRSTRGSDQQFAVRRQQHLVRRLRLSHHAELARQRRRTAPASSRRRSTSSTSRTSAIRHLQPEEGKNTDLGITWSQGGHSVKLVGYDNKIQGFITNTTLPQNIPRARIEGWTLGYDGQFGDLGLHASFDSLDPRNESHRQAAAAPREGRRPRWRSTTPSAPGSSAARRCTSAAASTTRPTRCRLDPYTTVDLYAEYQVAKDWSRAGPHRESDRRRLRNGLWLQPARTRRLPDGAVATEVSIARRELILGGQRSGKSRRAEQLRRRLARAVARAPRGADRDRAGRTTTRCASASRAIAATARRACRRWPRSRSRWRSRRRSARHERAAHAGGGRLPHAVAHQPADAAGRRAARRSASLEMAQASLLRVAARRARAGGAGRQRDRPRRDPAGPRGARLRRCAGPPQPAGGRGLRARHADGGRPAAHV